MGGVRGGDKAQIWESSCLRYHAYGKMITAKMVFVTFGVRQRPNLGAAAVIRPSWQRS